MPRVGARLDHNAAEVASALRAAVLDEVPAFSASHNPEVLPELERHAAEHMAELRRLLGGGTPGALDFVRSHAQRRAEQRFPLEAVLHAYRCGHKLLSHWIRGAALASHPRQVERVVSAVADFSIEYTNTISTIAAAEYVAHTRVLAEAEGDRRTELLNILLNGHDEADGRVARLLERAGYLEQRLSFCVALAQSTDPLEMENPARAQRIVDAMAQAAASSSIRMLAGVRHHVVTAVYTAVRRASGWTAPQADLADRLSSQLLMLGPAVRVGISTDQPSTSFVPKALREASVALELASVNDRVVQFARVPIRRLLVHRGSHDVQSALPRWFEKLREADAKGQGALVRTLYAYADADMNVQRAAREVNVHPNTFYARMQRIAELTGCDAQRYHGLTELLLALDCSRGRPGSAG